MDACKVGDALFAHLRVRWLVLWILASSILVSVVGGMSGVRFMTHDSWPVLLSYGVLIAWTLLLCRKLVIGVHHLCGPLPHSATEALPMIAGVCVALVSWGGLSLLATWSGVQLHDSQSTSSNTSIGLLPFHSAFRTASAVLMLVVVIPVVEEIIFRRILIGRWRHVFGIRAAVVLSAGLFALLHASPVWAFLFALTLTALYLKCGNLWVSIGAHSLNNLTNLLWIPLQQLLSGQHHVLEGGAGDLIAPVALAIGALGLLVIFLRLPQPKTSTAPT